MAKRTALFFLALASPAVLLTFIAGTAAGDVVFSLLMNGGNFRFNGFGTVFKTIFRFALGVRENLLPLVSGLPASVAQNLVGF